MARKVVTLTEFFDDFDGEKIDDGLSETIEFAVQGTSYRMDLRRRTPRGSVKTLKSGSQPQRKWTGVPIVPSGRAWGPGGL
ncbi:hypothetical protein GS441_12230 [Rhodococcus hoagii]|uniref:Lsr2 dimerization domain-containing protein n=1 Tax=Rhodococcus hoagii TaxID=43767 RepID=A0A9Q2S4N5_RHOHA|nr:hypothetical protein [Prescottella equi]